MTDVIDADGVTVRPAPAQAHLLLHCEPDDAAAISSACGLDLPSAMLDSATQDGWSALHLAPDEWLLIGKVAQAVAITDRMAAVPEPLSLVDISDRSLAYDLDGPEVERLLASGCPMDLAPAAFPVGRCTRTLFGKAMVMLWRTGPVSFRLEVARSFAPYVLALLARAADEPRQAVGAS